ncbi:MAG: ABC transporter ATP-binding protein, partial [Bacteroidota bacterium]
PLAVVKWYYSKKMYKWERYRTSLEREANYLNQVLTTDIYAKEVRLFQLAQPLVRRFADVRQSLFKEKYRIGHQRAKAGLLAQGMEIIALVATYGFIIWRTMLGSITLGDLVMYFQAFQRGQGAIKKALQGAVGLYNNRLFLAHLFELLELSSRLHIAKSPQALPPTLKTGITLRNLYFSYPDTERQVLKNVNLEFKKGEVIALVGENGSGKTTLIKLLTRLYDPTAGAIYYDDVDIRETALESLRRRISVIYQDFAQYHFTVSDNIRIDNLAVEADVERVRHAARQSGAASFVETLPLQYEQQLGRRFRQGVELSGGQWQKIALARAFHKSAELIVLDEPTSAIDPLAEAAIFDELRLLAKNRIILLVTHRLYNLQMADRIVVLEQGAVVEMGTHQELFADTNGHYRKMFEQQMSSAFAAKNQVSNDQLPND